MAEDNELQDQALRAQVEKSKINMDGTYFITPKTFELLIGNKTNEPLTFEVVFFANTGKLGPYSYDYTAYAVSGLANSSRTKGSVFLNNGVTVYLASALVGDPEEE